MEYKDDLFDKYHATYIAHEKGEASLQELLIRTLKEEEVDLSEYLDYRDAYHQIGRFIEDVYIRRRIHPSLGYLTPAEFEAQWRTRQAVDVI